MKHVGRWPYSDRAHPCMGQSRARPMDTRSPYTEGKVFRAVARLDKVWGHGISQNVVWYVVRTCCEKTCLEHIAPHDLRRTCAKLCHDRGGELEQIQFLLGHASVQTTERYLGCKQNLGYPVNDLLTLEAMSNLRKRTAKLTRRKDSPP